MKDEKEIRETKELAMRVKTLYHDALHILADAQKHQVNRVVSENLSTAANRASKALDSLKITLAENGVFDESL